MYIWKLWYVCELWVPVKTYWCLWCSALFKYRLSALEWKVLKVSGGSAPASIDLPKDAVKCPLTIPPLSQMHYLPLVWCTFSPPDWDVLTPDLSSILCSLPAQNSIQLHSLYPQVFRHGVCLQPGWLRIIWKWERGLLWDRFEILIKTVRTVTDQDWSDCERPKTDNGSVRTEGKTEKRKTRFHLPSQS